MSNVWKGMKTYFQYKYMSLKDKIKQKKTKLPNLILSIYFGVPGSGKTTLAAALTKKHMRKGGVVFSNVPLKGAYRYCKDDLGKYDISDCLVILDEASIEFNSRKFKTMTEEAISFFKLHRHYRTRVCAFSQSWEDCDATIRRVAFDYNLVRKSLIPFVVDVVPIRRRVGVNDLTKEICDEYRFDHWLIRLFTTKRYFAPLYWKMFDSWEAPKLPPMKEMIKW